MNCVILQPSFIPWRGYFHQIQRADLFVFYDCVQYDKRGWRNRNRIKTAQGTRWITIPVVASGSHQGLPIRDVTLAPDDAWRKKHLATIAHAYGKTPFWRDYAPLVEEIYALPGPRLADITCAATVAIARALGITHTRFVRSGDLGARGEKTDRLLDLLTRLGATHYISGPSARNYIEADQFAEAGITLEYMVYDYPPYPQLYGPFDGHVSILDLLFNVGPDAPRFIWGQAGR